MAASTTSPLRAPWRVNQAKAAMSSTVRRKMSRLTWSMAEKRRGSKSGARGVFARRRRMAIRTPASPRADHSATRVPTATPRTPRPRPTTRATSRAMLRVFMNTCRSMTTRVSLRPMNQPMAA